MSIMWKHSIRLKMTAILVSIISLVLILTWILNVSFAEKYYIESEKSSIIRSYEQVKSSLKEMNSMDTLAEDLEQISDSSNARLMIIQSDGLAYNDQTVVFSNMHGGIIGSWSVTGLPWRRTPAMKEGISLQDGSIPI